MDSSSHFGRRAEQLYQEFLARRDAGELVDFDSLCAAEPRLAEELRAVRGDCESGAPVRPARESEPLLLRLRRQFGDAADLSLSLDGGPEQTPEAAGDAGASGEQGDSALLVRLQESGPRGTRYRLLGEVARGGMGAVLRVWDAELRRTLAMKVVLGRDEGPGRGTTTTVDPKTLGRFLEEAQITGQLDHPGIVPVHELGLDSAGRVYFTMKLVKGEDLRAVFDQVKSGTDGWSQIRALGVMLRVCEAMAFAHTKGVVHRDLKPANVMVGKFGEVYVMDWGLARVIGRADKHDLRLRPEGTGSLSSVETERHSQRERTPDSPLITMDGDVMGTPSYMAPEQARGELEKLGPHSDVYALGAMLYQLVTGTQPFLADEARVSPYMILMRVRDGPPKPVHELAPDAPAELVAIVEKAMARGIGERYPTTLALAEDLRAFVEGRVVHAYESGAWAEARKWVQRNKPLAAALAAAVLAILAGGAAFGVKAREATRAAVEATAARNDAVASAERAAAGELAARQNAEAAQRNAEAAQLARDEAAQKANDVLSLSAQRDLDDLVAGAAKMWPAHPEMAAHYEEWLRRANELIEGRPADDSLGIRKRPSIAEHEAKLAELRREAMPLAPDAIRADRESHSMYAELRAREAELAWQSRMLGLEPWQSEPSVEAELALESLPEDADALNALAWPLVDPAKPVYGGEVRALLLARRAVLAAAEAGRSAIRDTLAWALYRVGRLDEALAEARTALGEPGGLALEGSAADLERSVSAWRGDELAKRRERRAALAAEIAALETAVGERRTFEFADRERDWWNRQLAKLVSDLEALRDPEKGLMSDVVSEPFGWGVAKRFAFARTIGERSVSGPEAARLWSAAIASIRSSPKYGGLTIEPQIGLLPLGTDPDSGLQEFAHLQTGEAAARGADGKLVLTEDTGLVFVLIPGGTFSMGAQRTDPNGPNHDPRAEPQEAPVHEVELSPYFLSKYEMTQGQWQRIAGRNPSYYTRLSGRAPSLLHPVEQVSWTACKELLDILGLSLPSEAQWECGARGGTSTPWWTGAERESLRGKVNLADRTSKQGGASWPEIADWPDLEDGSVLHGVVGKYAANPYGLHEVHGNVWEWCLDGYDSSYYGTKPRQDPVSPWAGSASRVVRGGCYALAAWNARSARRIANPPTDEDEVLGLRPARELRPSASRLGPPK